MHDWREYLVKVDAFYLGIPFGHQSSLLTIISFDVEDPMVSNYFTTFRKVHELKDFEFVKGL